MLQALPAVVGFYSSTLCVKYSVGLVDFGRWVSLAGVSAFTACSCQLDRTADTVSILGRHKSAEVKAKRSRGLLITAAESNVSHPHSRSRSLCTIKLLPVQNVVVDMCMLTDIHASLSTCVLDLKYTINTCVPPTFKPSLIFEDLLYFFPIQMKGVL